MTGAFRVMVAALHADPNLAEVVTYRRDGEADLPGVRVIMTRPEQQSLGVAGATLPSLEATIPIASLPFEPRRGDLLVLSGGVIRRVERRERDEVAEQWRLTLAKAPAA